MNGTTGCHCGSLQTFEGCCQPILLGSSIAASAEQLMRSRYSAFCTGNIDYLMATLHPSKHQGDERQQLAETIRHCQWLQLQVITRSAGQAKDDSGEVEFIARFLDDKKPGQLHERSRFIKENDRWYYLDGVFVDDVSPQGGAQPKKVGRNDPCWCGSGRKFKKCHG